MQEPQSKQQAHGPLTTPRAFRRSTGAHTIIVSLLLADLANFLLWMLLGALIGPPVWWMLRRLASISHATLLLDSALVLMLLCLAVGFIREHLLRMKTGRAWAWPATFIVILATVMMLIFLLKEDWMTIPALAIPLIPLEPFPWPIPLIPVGGAIAAGLSLIAHLVVLRRARKGPAEQKLAFSRAHPDGQIWKLIEQAYALYRKNLARFDPPPMKRLRTPATFYYYQRQTGPNEHPNPEREMDWRNGNLVLNEAYIGNEPEQTDIFLPILTRLLYNNNSPDALVERLFQFAQSGEKDRLSRWMLIIPLAVAQSCEDRWHESERERVLDKDRFANDCGEGKRLRRLVQGQREWLNENSLPDNTVPTLIERIDHLDSLINREARQLKNLHKALPPGETDNTP